MRALAESLNDASPDLPPLTAETTTQLALELERARPKAAAATIPLRPVQPARGRCVPLAAILAAVAIGLVAAFAHSSKPHVRRTVQPVTHGSSAREEAANLSAWLTSYSK